MKKQHLIILIASVVASLLVVGGALAIAVHRKKLADAPVVPPHTVSKSELAADDGKAGRPCLVAIDGLVYQIRDFSQWQNGEHTTSNGLAYCGADLSKVIDKAPHGRKVLDLLIKVGPLQK
jgi:predicted heme/steroid binding protein